MRMDSSEKGNVLVDQRHSAIKTHTPWTPPVSSHVTTIPSHVPVPNCDGMNNNNHRLVNNNDNNRTPESRPSTSHDDAEQPLFTAIKRKGCSSRSQMNIRENSQASTADVTGPPNDSGGETEIIADESNNHPVPVDVSVERGRLVKLYAWIKEEMERSTARSVANQLFQDARRLLSRSHHEAILHCSRRRDASELLLKQVLMGSSEIHEPFMVALRRKNTTQCHIADKLASTLVSAAEMNAFRELELYSHGMSARPESHEPRLSLSDIDYNTCINHLNTKTTLDVVNDNLLSHFIFSIREHTNIVNCSMDREQKVKELLNTLKLCANKTFRDFCEICTEHGASSLVNKLEKRLAGQKRKSNTKPDHTSGEGSSSEKRQCLSAAVEHKLVSSLQQGREHVDQQASELIGFNVETVNNGSIVLQLRPQCADSWRKLKENCHTGKIREFIPAVYRNESNLLPEGEYKLKFTIYELPSHESKDDKKAMFHLETETEHCDTAKKAEIDSVTPSDDNPIEEHMDLLCEELELSAELLTLLKEEGLVAGNIKAEIDKQGSRAKKIRFLLNKLATHGSKGYAVLKQYIKTDNEDLYRELETQEKVKVIDSAMDTAAKVTRRPSSAKHRSVFKREVFFTGTVVLVVKKKSSSPIKENVAPDQHAQSEPQLEITCPKILNPVCHFSAKGEDKEGKSGEVTMVLEEAWTVVGADNPSKREILVGKRKQTKPSDQNQKRTHGQSDNDDKDDKDAENDQADKPDLRDDQERSGERERKDCQTSPGKQSKRKTKSDSPHLPSPDKTEKT